MTRTTRRDLVKLGGRRDARRRRHRSARGRAPARHHGRRLPIGYPLGPFTRDKANPILKPGTQPWESKFVFNPAAIVRNGLVHLLYRAQGPDGRSSIGLATSSDGVHFTPPQRARARRDRALRAARRLRGRADRRAQRHLLHDLHGLRRRQRPPVPRHLAQPPELDEVRPALPGLRQPATSTSRGASPARSSRSALNGSYFMYFGDKDIYYASRPTSSTGPRARSTTR